MDAASVIPLIHIDLTWTKDSANPLVIVLAYTAIPLTAILLGDFGYYWFHRMQHRIGFLWRFHRVHHSIEELSVLNSYAHVSERILQLCLIWFPLALMLKISVPEVAVLAFVFGRYGIFIHTNTNLSFYAAKYFISEPRYHRIHHSIEPLHHNKNFALAFPIWDVIFGTAYWPKHNEFPKTGLSDLPPPRSLMAFLFPPRARQHREGMPITIRASGRAALPHETMHPCRSE
jgi:sterol desaturase/sphingolipid hydroxylase (fatty acid hydroxylase superfamily)